jgi:DNA-binding MarR family transcriptional regulator
MAQWYFLRELWQQDGLTQRELSSRIGLREPTTVSIVRGMERNGLIRRVRNGHDGRKVNIFLTPSSERMRTRLLPFAAQVNKQAARGLTSTQLQLFCDVMLKMRKNLASEIG